MTEIVHITAAARAMLISTPTSPYTENDHRIIKISDDEYELHVDEYSYSLINMSRIEGETTCDTIIRLCGALTTYFDKVGIGQKSKLN